MAWGNIFGNVTGGQIQGALNRVNPYGLGGGQPLTQNPMQVNVSDNDIRRAIAASNGMQQRAEAVENVPGGMLGKAAKGGGGWMGMANGALSALSAAGQQPAALQRNYNQQQPIGGPYSQSRDIGDENQKKAFSKLGSLIGAVGSFYTGNYPGMAAGIKGLSG